MASATLTKEQIATMLPIMEAGVKLAAVAGKGAETKPCGSHSPTIKCAAELCCGNWVRTPAEIAV